MSDIKPDVTLNCKGLNCPMPLIKTKKALDSMEIGQILLLKQQMLAQRLISLPF